MDDVDVCPTKATAQEATCMSSCNKSGGPRITSHGQSLGARLELPTAVHGQQAEPMRDSMTTHWTAAHIVLRGEEGHPVFLWNVENA